MQKKKLVYLKVNFWSADKIKLSVFKKQKKNSKLQKIIWSKKKQ